MRTGMIMSTDLSSPMRLPVTNLHSHTHLCKHASGTVSDYCQVALHAGMRVFGMADHCPLPEVNQFCDTRMTLDDLPVYRAELDEAIERFPGLTILSGMELDYFPKYGPGYYQDMMEQWNLDYYIGGVHYVFDEHGELIWRRGGAEALKIVRNCVRQAIELMETGLLDYMTHPDNIGYSIDGWTRDFELYFRELIEAAIAHDLPLEVNAYGIRKGLIETRDGPRWRYPLVKFWELAAEYSPKVVIGADAHSPETLTVAWLECQHLLDDLGLVPVNEQLAQKIIERSKRNGPRSWNAGS